MPRHEPTPMELELQALLKRYWGAYCEGMIPASVLIHLIETYEALKNKP